MKPTIRKYALQNALKFGKANPGAVIGKLLAEDSSLKSKIKDVAKDVQAVIKEIAKLTPEKIREELEKTAPELLEEKKGPTEKVLPELKNARLSKVVMRFEPSPSGSMHIGHAYVMGLNAEYVKRYNGKLILRIGDTNPENIYPAAYELLEDDAKWLTKKGINEVLIQSDRLEIYYNYMERLIGLEKAYICTCDPEKYRELSKASKACPCRGMKEQLKRWRKMFDGFKQGEAVGRIKTDLKDKNPAMRDFPVFRIAEGEHPRQKKKYRVWPLMNMAVTVDDIESGVTHVIRAKDHVDNAKRQEIMYGYLGKKAPEALFVGRINFQDMPVSATQTRKDIDDGKYVGWDDIRLPFLQALQKRGYQPETFVKYATDVGLSLSDKKVSKEDYFKAIDAFNRDIIDEKAYRYFFVANPVKIKIDKAPSDEKELDLHPTNKKGGRKFKTSDVFYISQDDVDSLEGGVNRLMDCLNFTKKGKKYSYHSPGYEVFKESGEKIMHWVSEEHLNVEVLMPDNKIVSGLGEMSLKSVKVGTVVQLERFGFCRLESKDMKNKELVFWFGHK